MCIRDSISGMLSFRPNTAIKKPAPARDRERIFTYPFLRETIPMMMLDTSIPRAQIVSAVPSVALSEKASTIGVNKVCRKPRKKVITEERRTSSRTPLRCETARQPVFSSLKKASSRFFLTEAAAPPARSMPRTASVVKTVRKKVQISITRSRLISDSVRRKPARMGDTRYLADPVICLLYTSRCV